MNKMVQQESALISDSLSGFFGRTLAAIPEGIRERDKYFMLDAIGVAFAASSFGFSKQTSEQEIET